MVTHDVTTADPQAIEDSNGGAVPSPRGDETRRVIIEVAIELLDENGEQGLRIAEVQRRSGISIGSIYHHFGGRDGLIQAARARQFRASHPTHGLMIAELAESASSADEFVAGLANVIRTVHSEDRAAERFQRLVYIGSAMSRPDLLDELRAQQTELIEGAAELVQQLVDRGWVRDDVSARALVTFALALELGSVVADLDLQRIDDETWSHIVHVATSSLFKLDASGAAPPAPS
jgi:AcrR family transcriptional regulator